MGRLLGQGTFAKVYYGKNIATSESVAIKVINKDHVLKKEGMIDQIKREISVMRLVKHPNVVELKEVMATKQKIFFVMEYIKGGELFSKVAKGKKHFFFLQYNILIHLYLYLSSIPISNLLYFLFLFKVN